MPLYQCLVPAGFLDDDRRASIAGAVTDIHSSVTGAPRGFIHVVFVEYEPSAFFTAGKPHAVSVISGTIRAGRDQATRAALLTQLSEAWTAITGQDVRDLVLGLSEVDATSIMEAGLIMPAPGAEAAWLDRHREALGELLSSE
jgi:phenylpyruvate tautomerase PptA (4-oxalocrotonate tautomerase family)